ncbi:hypothetical protein [Streptomyces sp. NPDC059957]|uniref:hypothetical protein n=1 Tax=unclassified Streptomyces TaxID=2593676 RepID=UPI0036698973
MGFMRFGHIWGSALAVAGGAALLLGSLSGPAVAEVTSPFEKRYDEALYGDFVTLGNTVTGCPQAPPAEAAECAGVQRGGGTKNNNDFVAEPVDAAGLRTDTGTSSTGLLTVSPGAEVAYARLFWGGNNGAYRLGSNLIQRCDVSGENVVPAPGDPLTTRPVVKVGSGAARPVTLSDMVEDPAGTGGPHYYTGESDVTAAFADVATGSPVTVAVGNIRAPRGRGCVAGWSLTVVYAYPDPNEHAPERRNVYVYGGHVLQRSTGPDTTVKVSGFHRTGDGPVRAGATAYEGDRNTKGDQPASPSPTSAPSPTTAPSSTPSTPSTPSAPPTTQQPRPLPATPAAPGGSLATTGSDSRELWLMGTAAATLTALGGVVFLSVRRTRRH